MLASPLSWEKYSEKFQMLLYLEELQMEVDIRRYNIPNEERECAVMTRDTVNKKLLVMEVNVPTRYSSNTSGERVQTTRAAPSRYLACPRTVRPCYAAMSCWCIPQEKRGKSTAATSTT